MKHMGGIVSRVSTSIAVVLVMALLPIKSMAEPRTPGMPKTIPGRVDMDLGLRGGYFFQLNSPVADSVTERDPVQTWESMGVDLEMGPCFRNKLSVLMRFGYQARLETWESPAPNDVADLTMVYSQVHLPSLNIKYRPIFWRVSPYFTAGAGLDLILYSPSIYVTHPATVIRLPALGVNAGAGVEFYLTWQFAFVIDVRYHLAVHGTDELSFIDGETEQAFYGMEFAPTHHNLNVFAGVQLKL
jgi:hypothetical protein